MHVLATMDHGVAGEVCESAGSLADRRMRSVRDRSLSSSWLSRSIIAAMKKFTDLFRRKEPTARRTRRESCFQGKLAAFQRLLEENNAVLAAMADLEEKRSGEFLFDRAYLTTTFGSALRRRAPHGREPPGPHRRAVPGADRRARRDRREDRGRAARPADRSGGAVRAAPRGRSPRRRRTWPAARWPTSAASPPTSRCRCPRGSSSPPRRSRASWRTPASWSGCASAWPRCGSTRWSRSSRRARRFAR